LIFKEISIRVLEREREREREEEEKVKIERTYLFVLHTID